MTWDFKVHAVIKQFFDEITHICSVGSPWLSPMSPQLRNIDSPLITVKSGAKMSPIHSPISVRAYLGPLSPNDASLAKNEWKKHSPANKMLRLSDPDKGLDKDTKIISWL